MNSVQRDRLAIILAPDYLFSETYCGGYSGEDPPLPIPNREVKLTIADGTAPPGGRVGSCHFLIRDPDIIRCRGLLLYTAYLYILHTYQPMLSRIVGKKKAPSWSLYLF